MCRTEESNKIIVFVGYIKELVIIKNKYKTKIFTHFGTPMDRHLPIPPMPRADPDCESDM